MLLIGLHDAVALNENVSGDRLVESDDMFEKSAFAAAGSAENAEDFAGCYCGFNAANNSQGVGRGATKAVVCSIFLIVVADVFITVLYSFIGY